MNIFVLSENPIKAARLQHDKHILKMVLETAQMLCSAFENAPYKKTYINHPCTVWARTSRNNFDWLVLHGLALATEYTYRYNKTHASEKVISWCYKNADLIKFPKKKQDLRMDLPTIGLQTIMDCKKYGLKGIILKSKKNIFLDKTKCIHFAIKTGYLLKLYEKNIYTDR